MTATETLLLQIKLAGLPLPALEHQSHPTRKWRFDLAYPTQQVAIEIHGGIHTQGRHTRGKGFETDREKMNEAQIMGWIVLEVTEAQVESGQALNWVERALGRPSTTVRERGKR